uniref:Uncharacterized protein n=1 Tax=viral metagenome TaxID=1070528 RepID=A0A6C0BI29_9ZZZZ
MDESSKNRKKIGGGFFNSLFGISIQTVQQSRDTSDLLNKILKWMLSESSLLDFYALASPDECKNYVVFTAKNLNELFNKINVYPVQDSEGSISFSWLAQPTIASSNSSTGDDSQLYFRSLKALKDGKGAYAIKQQELCNDIAFYYIRILQVFAALSLSVLDTEIPTDEQLSMLATIKAREGISQGTVTPIGFHQKGGQWVTREKIIRNPNFEILNDYLVKDWNNDYYRLSDDERDSHIIILTKYISKINTGEKKLRLNYLDGSKQATASLILEKVSEDEHRLSLIDITVQERSNDSITNITFKGDIPSYRNQSIPRFLKNTFKSMFDDSNYTEESTQKDVSYKLKLEKLSKIPEQLKMPSIWKSIARSPPIKAYCVSRALQLLSPGAGGKTSICNTSFSLIKTGSLPDPKRDVRETPGILALNLLFFDKIMGATPKINDPTKYRNFIKYLRQLYNDAGTNVYINKNTSGDPPIRNTTAPIRNTTAPPLCKDRDGPLYTKDDAAIRLLQEGFDALMSRQAEHTAAVALLIQKLFYIGENNAIFFHPVIQKGGLEEVNRIAVEARDLLISYYQDCEKSYRDTVFNIISSGKAETFSTEQTRR